MFEYCFTEKDGEINILTPFVEKFDDIKKDITQTADCIINKSTYPNGVYIEVYQYSDRVVYKCNKEFIDNGDGTFTTNL